MNSPWLLETIGTRQPGPICQEGLSPEVLDTIGMVYEVIAPYIDCNLEQFEVGFMRAVSPEREVALWCGITLAWMDYHRKFTNHERLEREEEQRLLSALIVISTGADAVAHLDVPEEVGHRLRQCYKAHSIQEMH